MTIELKDVTKKVRLGAVKLTYEGLNLRIEKGARVAFLGNKNAGLDAIVNLICAADAPDKGKVTRTHSISWPIPDNKFISKHLSLAANARFVARLYEQNENAFLQKVVEMAEPGEFLNTRCTDCPREVLSRFCFSAGVCVAFDCYIFTSASIGGKEDKPRFAEIIEEVAGRAGILFVTADIKSAKQFCDQAYVFDAGRATYFDDMEAAAEFFAAIASPGGEDDQDFFDSDPELESMINTDF
jgi:capsular polysaccharide transport system ATP-binding protein